MADPCGFEVYGVGLRSPAFLDCGFEYRPNHESLFCECCVLGRRFCVRPITRPEESHQCVSLSVIKLQK